MPRIVREADVAWEGNLARGNGSLTAASSGAFAALHRQGASLLPGGVLSVEGEFRRGDVVEVATGQGDAFARGIAQYSAGEIRRIARRHSNEIEAILGFRYGESVVHRDDLVLLDSSAHKEATP